MKRTLFITDLDGTLLNNDRLVTKESSLLINDAIIDGAYFSIATARTPATVSKLMEYVHSNMPYVVMTGAALWNPITDTFENVKSLSRNKAEEITYAFIKNAVPALVYCMEENKIHMYRLPGIGYSEYEKNFVEEKKDNPNKTIHIDSEGNSLLPDKWETPIFFFSIQKQENIDKVYNVLKNIKDIDILQYQDPGFPGLTIMEVRKSGVSKANAIIELKKRYNIETVYAYGDNKNDIPMLKVADISVAVANAIPEVKEIADIVLKDIPDAVAKHIYETIKDLRKCQ